MMNWSRLYGLKSYLKSSLWLVPFVAIPLELVTTRFLHRLDAWLGWTLLGFTQTGARALLEAFATITLSFVVSPSAPCLSFGPCVAVADSGLGAERTLNCLLYFHFAKRFAPFLGEALLSVCCLGSED